MNKRFSGLLIGSALLIISCNKNESNSAPLPSDDESSAIFAMRDAGGSSGGVDAECKACLLPYPDNSNLPRSGAIFNENEVLVASEPGILTCGTNPAEIKVWYADEHPLCMGVRQVVIKTATGSTTSDYTVTASPLAAAFTTTPEFGAIDQSGGDFSGNDVSVDGGRPLWPSLFVTDITDNRTWRTGDWQQGGKAFTADKVYGMWKAAVKIVDKTKATNQVTILVDPDPKKTNGWNLAGGQAPPAGTRTDKFGALITWNVEKLGLLPGHIYRLQFMVHDGDQNKVGGDVGQTCTTIIMPD